LLPRGILPIIISSPDTKKPTSIIDTCSTQRIYGNGYSFCLPENHTLEREETPNVSQKIILTSTITWDTITINHNFLSTSYTDSDNKFGDVNVVYNAEKKIWEATGGCDTPKKCNSSFYNKQGIHVFVGRSRWLTYIVPFDNGGIVVLNSSGG